jgi:pimeloyl-ACP methyl ester carboxylesterase
MPYSPLLRCAIVIVAATAALRCSAAEPARPESATQIWLVDTRCASGCGDLEAGQAQIRYWRRVESNGCCQWQAADAAAFQAAADPTLPTTVLIHGYGTNADWAVRHGNELYADMLQLSCGRPFRLVVWSWPADRSTRTARGIRPDIRMKACRSDAEAYYLARLLSGLPSGEPLSLIGFSLGCRAQAGALHLLAGGTLAGRSLPPGSLAAWKGATPRPIRAMMLAAAIDDDWLAASAPEGLAPVEVQRILISQNCRDRVLRWYSRLYGPHGPEALGRIGPAGSATGKLEVVDVTCEVGRKHQFERYEVSCPVWQRLGWYTFLDGSAAVAVEPAKKPALAALIRGGTQ